MVWCGRILGQSESIFYRHERRGGVTVESVVELLNGNVATIPILLFFMGMLCGVILTYLMMKQ